MTDAYTAMKNALEPLCLYSFENTAVAHELYTYAMMFDEHKAELLQMLDECFVDTAQSYGLAQRELIVGAVRDDLTVAQRRNMLRLRESIDKSSFTVPKIKNALKSFGLEVFELYEYPSLYTVVVDAQGSFSTAQKAWIRSQVKKIMPAHLDAHVVFNGPSWNTSDSKNNSFYYIDSLNYTWETIDNL